MPQGEYLQYGGQAIIEGVMMRSPRFFSVACRAPNGEIVVETEALEKTWIGRQKWLKLPFLRGSLALLDAMSLGIRAMKFAANVQVEDKYQPKTAAEVEDNVASHKVEQANKRVQEGVVAGTMVFSLAFGFLLFNYLPNAIAELSQRGLGVTNERQINVVAEVVKIVIFLGYIALIGQLKDVKEVFKYHGAEHKAINTLEREAPLEIEQCRLSTRLHPRCGTSFAIIVLIVGLIVFTFVPRYPVTGHQGNPLVDITVRVGIELLILPFIAGISYELLRLAGKFRNQTLVNLAFKPGIWSQYLTTREPDEKQIEVALVALQAVIDAEDHASGVSPKTNALESAPEVIVTLP
jgi:uncharacterized protein YqhQ